MVRYKGVYNRMHQGFFDDQFGEVEPNELIYGKELFNEDQLRNVQIESTLLV